MVQIYIKLGEITKQPLAMLSCENLCGDWWRRRWWNLELVTPTLLELSVFLKLACYFHQQQNASVNNLS